MISMLGLARPPRASRTVIPRSRARVAGSTLASRSLGLFMAASGGVGYTPLVPEQGLQEMAQWLEAGHQHFICSAAILPVARAILNIWPLDPYLARHFLLGFTPLLCEATEADYLAVFAGRDAIATPQHAWVEAYMKLERKLHRAYLDH